MKGKDGKAGTLQLIWANNLNSSFWDYYHINEIKLSHEELIKLHRLQQKMIFEVIKKSSKDNLPKFDRYLKMIFSDSHQNNSQTHFWRLDTSIWNSTLTLDQLCNLAQLIKTLPTYDLLGNRQYSEWKVNDTLLYAKIVKEYSYFMHDLVEVGSKFAGEWEIDELKYFLGLNSRRKHSSDQDDEEYDEYDEDISSFPEFDFQKASQIAVLEYMKFCENTASSQKYIMQLCSVIEAKYVMTFVIFKMLYTGSDRELWKNEVIFFKEIFESHTYNSELFKRENIEFVKSHISNSNIGHRIGAELIQWIFENMHTNIDEALISKCMQKRYMSYSTLIALRYIFNGNSIDYYAFKKLNNSIIESTSDFDWRIVSINELSAIKDVCKEKSFFDHFRRLFDYPQLSPSLFDMSRCSPFEAFIFIEPLIEFDDLLDFIKTEKVIPKSIYDFLLVKVCKYNELGKFEILCRENQSIRKEYSQLLERSQLTVEEYIDSLEKSMEYIGYSIQAHFKEFLVQVLKSTILKIHY